MGEQPGAMKTPPMPPAVKEGIRAIFQWMLDCRAPAFTQFGQAGDGRAVVLMAFVDEAESVARIMQHLKEAQDKEGLVGGGKVDSGNTVLMVPVQPAPLPDALKEGPDATQN